jgi:hypothetical protein
MLRPSRTDDDRDEADRERPGAVRGASKAVTIFPVGG